MIDFDTLLQTKLYAPEPRIHLVARPRLIARLNDGLALGHRLSLVCAPAGYGKTMLVCQWLNQVQNAECGMRSVEREDSKFRIPHSVPKGFGWLALEEADNDIARFFAYLAAAVQQVDPRIGQITQSMLSVIPPPPATSLATALVNELAQAAEMSGTQGAQALCPIVLVLDDYQHIQTPAVHQMVEFLVEHAPPHVHFVIITREDPPFALPRLRVRGQLTEIREEDLRFTLTEAASFLNETMRLGLSDGEIVALDNRTEGWIAGLQLAGLSLRDREPDDRGSFVAAFSGSNRYIIDYLVDEVLRRQPEELRRFLCRTAILDRLCASLCDAVTGREDSREMLAHLDQVNLFVVPLDDRREWYRYHRLFADCLDTQLPEGERASLHRTAARWLEAHGLAAEAARHALAVGDNAHVGRLVSSMAPGSIARGEMEWLLHWLDALPREMVRDSLDLAMYRAWTLFLTGRLKEAVAAVTPMRARLPAETDPAIRARMLVLLSWLANIEEDAPASAQMAGEATGLTGSEESLLRVLALDLRGEAEVRLGAEPAATRSFREGIELAERLNQPFATIAMLYNLATNLNRQGRRRDALSLCRNGLSRYSGPGGRPLPVATQLYVPLAWLHYEANELEQARDYLQEGLETRRDIGLNSILLIELPWLQVNLRLAEGDGEGALVVAREARRAAQEAGHERLVHFMVACEAYAQLRLGDAAPAERWAIEGGLWDSGASQSPDPAHETMNLVLAELFLATGRIGDARALLQSLERSALDGERHGRLIRIHLLQSAAELVASSEPGALRYLEEALRLAASEGYVRAFIDEGAAVSGLLPGLRHLAPAFVDVLMEATANAKRPLSLIHLHQPQQAGDSIPQRPKGTRIHTPQLLEPLSEQEMRVLRLLAARMSNQEIASELVVTVGTVKWHVHNIYGKLGAGSRAQAVARARQLGLLM